MRFAVAIFVVFTLILSSAAAFGCKCAPPPEGMSRRQLAEWHAKGVTAIFEGKVARAELKSVWLEASVGDSVPASIDEVIPVMLVTFDILRSYRGVQGQRVEVETGLGGGDCGFGFEIGKEYLVYADRTESGQLSTGICTATAPVEKSGANLAYLRGEPILPGKSANQSNPKTSRLCVRMTPTSSEDSDEKLFLFRVANKSPIPSDEADAEPQENGLFCADDLEAGSYLVLLTKGPEESPSLFAYYPGVMKPSEATSIDIRLGQTVSDLVFRRPSEPTFSVSGTVSVVGKSQLPRKAGVVLISADQPFSWLIYRQDLASDGSFAFPKVLVGRYWGFVDVESDIVGKPKWYTRKIELSVDKNVTDLHLALLPE